MMEFKPYCLPGTSLKNKTGSWREFKPIVNKEKCIKCKLCAMHCPDGCIIIAEGGAKINYDYCKGCGICKNECKINVIDFIREK
jgi:2-oxoacid:acceptor oxidoreductase delta subunit (pyruvate/2-ketoisovalerate family)